MHSLWLFIRIMCCSCSKTFFFQVAIRRNWVNISLCWLQKLAELEKEEEMREKAGYYDSDESEEDEEMQGIRKLAGK